MFCTQKKVEEVVVHDIGISTESNVFSAVSLLDQWTISSSQRPSANYGKTYKRPVSIGSQLTKTLRF